MDKASHDIARLVLIVAKSVYFMIENYW